MDNFDELRGAPRRSLNEYESSIPWGDQNLRLVANGVMFTFTAVALAMLAIWWAA